MLKSMRQQQILEILNEKEMVAVADLSKQLETSSMTIRKDLKSFEEAGIIRRIHGGAVLVKSETVLPPYVNRIGWHQQEKDGIGKAAMSLTSPDDVICIDSGTTAQAMVRCIPEDCHMTVISTSIMTSQELAKNRNLDIIQVGGLVHHSSFAVCNLLAANFIKQLNADIAFLCTRAIDVDTGTLESSMTLVEEKRALASISKKVVLLADHTKFEGRALLGAVSIKDINTVITDSKAPKEAVSKLRSEGIEVIIVD